MGRAVWCGKQVLKHKVDLIECEYLCHKADWLGKRIDVLLSLGAWTLEVDNDEIVIFFTEHLEKLPLD